MTFLPWVRYLPHGADRPDCNRQRGIGRAPELRVASGKTTAARAGNAPKGK